MSPNPSATPITGVIVTYRSSKTIRECLASAKRCADAGLMEVIVVDNASPDDTREILAREAGFARVMLGDANIGFGRGCNVGLHAASSDLIVFINPDAIVEPDAIRTIVEFMRSHPQCAIAGPAISRDDGPGFQHVGGLLTPWDVVSEALGLHRTLAKRQHLNGATEPFKTNWVSGAMLIGRTKLLRDLGGFDPRYFLYWEETDLCRRTLDAGHEIWAIPTARVHHVGGVSAQEEERDDANRVRGCIATHYYQSRYYYLHKHFGAAQAALAEAAEVVLLPLSTLARKLLGKPVKAPPLRRWRHPMFRVPKVV
jgi:GT2 family glycosyltransferase